MQLGYPWYKHAPCVAKVAHAAVHDWPLLIEHCRWIGHVSFVYVWQRDEQRPVVAFHKHVLPPAKMAQLIAITREPQPVTHFPDSQRQPGTAKHCA